MTQLSETVYQEKSIAERVDTTAGIIRGVKVLGEASKNGRRYTRKAMKEAAPLYNGAKAFVDHPDRDRLSEDRKFRDWSGVYENARYEEGRGIFADLRLRQTGDYFEGIIEAAQKFPTSVGLSHVAEGDSRREGDTEIVESIKEVFSVDLVTDPATTAGFFESHRKPKKLRDVIESLPEGVERKRLVEMVGDMSMGDYGDASDEPSDPLAKFSSLTKELVRMLGETLKALAMKQDKPAPPAPAANPVETEAEVETDTEEVAVVKKKTPPEFESVQKEMATKLNEALRQLSEQNAKNMLLESDREAKPEWVKALANAAVDDQRDLLDSLPLKESQDSDSLRPPSSPPIRESANGHADFPRDDPKKFAAALR